MKEIYNWVPWFNKLSHKIAENGDEYLATHAREIPWREDGTEPALLKFGDEHIDPFSFINYLGSLARHPPGRKRVYKGVEEVFGVPSPFDCDANEEFIFPQSRPDAALFNDSGRGNPAALWRLFRSAVDGVDSVAAEDFNMALQIRYVAIKKLTQTLCLVNAHKFLPYDDAILSLGITDRRPVKDVNWETYQNDLVKTREAFPGCRPYEISLFAYESSKSSNPLKVSPDRCFQISTNVYNDHRDMWEDFSSNNWAYTGGPGEGSWSDYKPDAGQRRYPLDKPQPGDILLVRYTNAGHGVGVVYRNDYLKKFAEDARLHVLWLNKSDTALSTSPLARGFGHGHGKIGDAFRQAYAGTFRILDQMGDRGDGRDDSTKPKGSSSNGSSQDPRAQEHALNTILYGPPGTGKTFATVQRCVEICDGGAPQGFEDLRARYGKLMDEGRIEFVTFHQSYGYEEFVEGFRPVSSDSEGSGLQVSLVSGVLRRIAERARKVPEIGARRIFKMSLGDPKSWGGKPDGDAVLKECIDSGCVLLEYGGDIDWSGPRYDDGKGIWDRWRKDRNPDATAHDTDIQAMWRFRTEMRKGDLVVASDGYRHFRALGEITGDYEFERRQDGFHHRRAVQWHWHVSNREGDSVSVFKAGFFQWRPINQMKPANPGGLIPYLNGVGEIGDARPHVLVIDEINRANVSKVMGELITLLEEDKREGAENEVALTLSYSRDQFTLPANLHVLGTMNTADRSIALLDTALRRRFRFEEMPPRPELLTESGKLTGVDLGRVLRAMNERLEYLVDRDHQIGHAWFMGTKTREDVDAVMRHKIIPLIAEYFYDDWGKVCAVLGGTDDFVKQQRLGAPPGLEADTGEDRYRWTVQEEFAEEAYARLIEPVAPSEGDK